MILKLLSVMVLKWFTPSTKRGSRCQQNRMGNLSKLLNIRKSPALPDYCSIFQAELMAIKISAVVVA